jgi:acetolactate synthase-1/2/3 large subunit
MSPRSLAYPTTTTLKGKIKMTTLNGGQLAARTLKEANVEVIFGVHGGHLDSFLMGCAEQDIKVIDCRHEAAAVNAADGYARTTGGLGVAFVTSGPGLTNGLAGITTAAADDVPVLVITSSSPIREIETRELQGGLDLISMVQPVTRWAKKILSAERTPDMVSLGIRHALAQRGPVVIDMPIDVAFTPVEEASLSTHGHPLGGLTTTARTDSIDAAARLLEAADRPVVVVGEGALSENIRDSLVNFAEATGTPVFNNLIAPYGLPQDHDLSGGNTMSLGFLKPGPDLVVLVGARQGMFTGGRDGGTVPPGARVIQLDPDAAEIGRLYPVDQALVGALGASLDMLTDAGNWPPRTEWQRATTSLPALGNVLFPDTGNGMEPDGIHPHSASGEIISALPEDAILVFDGGEAPLWVLGALGKTRTHTQLNLGYQGHLGSGQGYAMGAQVAHPDRRVIQIAGDGAIAFHIQEWDTMVRHGLPVITIIFNNACWGMSIHGQHAVYDGKDVATRLAPTAYETVGIGFGTYGELVETTDELKPAIERALASGKPAVINVRTSAQVVHPITHALLGDLDADNQIVVPYYQNLPK